MGDLSLVSMAAWGVGIYLMLYVVGVLMMWQKMLRLVIKAMHFEVCPVEDCSEDERELFEHWVSELEDLGFELVSAFSTRELFEGLVDLQPGLAMRHRERHDTWALLCPDAAADPRMPVALTLHTPIAGALLTTMNGIGAGMPVAVSGSVVVDPDVFDFKGQWDVHLAKILELAPATPDDAVEFSVIVSKLIDLDRRQITELINQRIVKGSLDEGMHLRLWAGLKWSLQILKEGKNRRQRFVRVGDAKPAAKVPPTAKMMAFTRMEKAFAGPSPTLFWAWLLLGSFVLFPISMLQLFELRVVLVILGVLTVHELGHYGAMRLFRYRDTRIFFIPFLGGAAVGKQRDASLNQEMIVLLAGPMPGIFIAFALLLFYPSFSETGLGSEIVLYTLVINILNLLPIFPLDGGRVVHRLLLGRNPYIETGFRLLGAALFVLAGFVFSDMLWLAIGGFLMLGMRNSLQMSKFETRLRAQSLESEEEGARLRRLFAAQEEDPSMQGKALSSVLVRQLVDRLEMQRAPGFSLGSWLGLYCGCFGAVFVLAVLTVAANQQSEAAIAKRDLKSAIAFYERDWLALPTEQRWDCSARSDNETNTAQVAVFSCSSPSEDEANALMDLLDPGGTGDCYQPWKISSMDAEKSNAHRKARRTLRLLNTYSYELSRYSSPQASSLVDQIDKNSSKEEKQEAIEALKQEFEERQKGLTMSLRAYIDNEGTALGLDLEVSELFLAQLNPGIDEDDTWRELNLRLGCVIEDVERSQTYVMKTSTLGNVFRLSAMLAPGPSMSQLADYLCAAGCEPLHYGVESDLPKDY